MAQAARIKEARIAAGFDSAAAAVRRFHWNEAAYRHHENGTRAATHEFSNYARAYKVSEAWLRCLTDDRGSGVRGARVIGQAALGVWHDEAVQPHDFEEPIISVPVRETDLTADSRFAIRVGDGSINKALPRDWYAICVPLMTEEPPVRDFVVGDILYIERRNKQGFRERSLRRVSLANATKMHLSTHSTDAKLKHDLIYPPVNAERVRLLGRMIGKYADYKPH